MTFTKTNWAVFYDELHGYVAARVRGASDVDDLVQLVLERAMQKEPEADIDNVAGWLFAIARNAIADYYRKQARTLSAAADELEADAALQPLGSSDEERARVVACIAPLLDTLDPADAQILRWADMEGWSMQGIAHELRISLTAAKSRVQRARKAFIKTTRECCAITKDARGRVVQLTPHPIPKALECASCVDRDPKVRRTES
jgi:RNA polymerase sigma-70 factor (ECF subfamily)